MPRKCWLADGDAAAYVVNHPTRVALRFDQQVVYPEEFWAVCPEWVTEARVEETAAGRAELVFTVSHRMRWGAAVEVDLYASRGSQRRSWRLCVGRLPRPRDLEAAGPAVHVPVAAALEWPLLAHVSPDERHAALLFRCGHLAVYCAKTWARLGSLEDVGACLGFPEPGRLAVVLRDDCQIQVRSANRPWLVLARSAVLFPRVLHNGILGPVTGTVAYSAPSGDPTLANFYTGRTWPLHAQPYQFWLDYQFAGINEDRVLVASTCRVQICSTFTGDKWAQVELSPGTRCPSGFWVPRLDRVVVEGAPGRIQLFATDELEEEDPGEENGLNFPTPPRVPGQAMLAAAGTSVYEFHFEPGGFTVGRRASRV